MASGSPWKAISTAEIAEHRKNLPKGHTREINTARTVGYDEIESDGDAVAIDAIPMPQTTAQAAPPREVAEDIYGMVWQWAQGSRENFALMAQIIRNSEPGAYGHLSDDELATKIEQHARDAARSATEKVYEQWDTGNNLDLVKKVK